MIVVDASAAHSVLLNEADREVYRTSLLRSVKPLMSAASVMECSIRIQRRLRPEGEEKLNRLLKLAYVEVCDMDFAQLNVARTAFGQYGKGMGHPAQLNFGDCFSDALAKTRDLPLLYTAHDFVHTDITSALPLTEI